MIGVDQIWMVLEFTLRLRLTIRISKGGVKPKEEWRKVEKMIRFFRLLVTLLITAFALAMVILLATKVGAGLDAYDDDFVTFEILWSTTFSVLFLGQIISTVWLQISLRENGRLR